MIRFAAVTITVAAAILNLWEGETLAQENWLSALEGLKAQAVLEVYSGQQDPSWDLTPGQTKDLLDRLATLEPGRATTPSSGLGYRGVSVTFPDDKQRAQIDVSSGVVIARIGDRIIPLADRDRLLETWLINTGSDQLPRDLFDYVSAEVAKRK